MDQQRRMVIFLVLSFGTMLLWLRLGVPFFFPELAEKQAARDAAAKQAQLAEKEDQDTPKLTESSQSAIESETTDDTAEEPATKAPSEAESTAAAEPAEDLPTLAEFPERMITLGTLLDDESTFLQLELTSRGAAVESLKLNDDRYRELTDRNEALKLLGEAPGRVARSFDLQIDAIDAQLLKQNTTLSQVHWKVDEDTISDREVTFRYPAPDGTVELYKTFRLRPGDPTKRDTDTSGYCVEVFVGFRNLSENQFPLTYRLLGPVGFPLEEEKITRRYLSLQAGFVNSGSVRHEQISAGEIAEQVQNNEPPEALRAPVRYVGIDGQYFATLLIPEHDEETDPWIAETQPLLMNLAPEESHSLISLAIVSEPLIIAAGESVEHQYTLYAGPKRSGLLRPFDADGIIEYGWFGAISKIMLAIMNFVHHTLFLPYGLSIIMLTVIVRGAMYPISRKNALAAKKMKMMQPRFEEIRKKYENDKEKLAKAQMELMKESGFFSGCLPMILQIPIFIGLYQALYVSVDLRMAEFLWIDNLAAPDRLFQMPFSIPFLGDDFNLLPMITVGLFVMQQKLFAPPPANDEQALQQKMMSYMMIIIGFMFYNVPAGLCVYFIASSGWAIAERKILDLHDGKGGADADPTKKTDPASPTVPAKSQPGNKEQVVKKPSWFQSVVASLDAAANPANKSAQGKTINNKNNKQAKKSSKRNNKPNRSKS